MRAPLSIALLLFAGPAFAAEEPSGCDKFKWGIEHERAALTAPDRAQLSSGGELAAMPATGFTLALLAPADAKLPSPPERAPKDGTLAGFAAFKDRPESRPLHDQPLGRCLGRCRAGWAFPEAQGVQRCHRLRGHPQNDEVRARGKPFRAAGLGHPGKVDLDRDPAVRIGSSCRNRQDAQSWNDVIAPLLPDRAACYGRFGDIPVWP